VRCIYLVDEAWRRLSSFLPDDGVHAPHLGRALQNTEGPGEGLGLVRRGQRRPVTTATSVCVCVRRERERGEDA